MLQALRSNTCLTVIKSCTTVFKLSTALTSHCLFTNIRYTQVGTTAKLTGFENLKPPFGRICYMPCADLIRHWLFSFSHHTGNNFKTDLERSDWQSSQYNGVYKICLTYIINYTLFSRTFVFRILVATQIYNIPVPFPPMSDLKQKITLIDGFGTLYARVGLALTSLDSEMI